jgi:response regulator RpfG family c-di-GMP phosphodiesterase
MSDRNDDDRLVFADEGPQAGVERQDAWTILIVDDEAEVHHVTKLVLSKVTFMNRGLRFLSAYSAAEAKDILRKTPDVAVALLDVVMEDESAGLNLVKYIRNELGNHWMRVILRTGQPGYAPESSVIVEYDINDYKEKTELTAQKLFTTMISAIRSYKDIVTIERSRKGLEKIIEASAHIFELQSLKRFASGVLEQITSLLNIDRDAIYFQIAGFTAVRDADGYYMLAATGEYADMVGRKLSECLDSKGLARVERAIREKRSTYEDSLYVGYIETKSGMQNVLFLDHCEDLSQIDIELINIYCLNVAVAFENIYLNTELEDTQKELIFTLGGLIEQRSRETGNHVKRVAQFVKRLGMLYGLTEAEAEVASVASAIHDVGKIAIPDDVLNKPGKLDDAEFELMKKHSEYGAEILKSSRRKLFSSAAIIAREHHEHWDGTGYPDGKAGEKIGLYARITAIADVFDALTNDRVYRKAWTVDEAKRYIEEQAGKQFDPELAEIFLSRFDDFLAIAAER